MSTGYGHLQIVPTRNSVENLDPNDTRTFSSGKRKRE